MAHFPSGSLKNDKNLGLKCAGGECVTREDIMEAIERASYGINDKQSNPSTISRELGKLFPWMPSLIGRHESRQDALRGPLGYQTLS